MTSFVGTYVLPTPIGLTPSCFGKRLPVHIGSQRVVIALPQIQLGVDGRNPQIVAPSLNVLPTGRGPGIALARPDPGWGEVAGWRTETGKPVGGWVATVALLTTFSEPIQYSDASGSQDAPPSSPAIEQLFASIDRWCDDLYTWIAVAVGQDTYYREPLETIEVPGQGLTIAAVDENGQASRPRSANAMTITMGESPSVNLKTLTNLLKRTSGAERPSDARLLLRDGYIDLRRRRRRKAVIDAGSAVESALATWCRTHGVTVASKPTLGWFVDHSGAPIPATTKSDLVVIRNDAIHNNITPTGGAASLALATADTILDTLEPL